MAKKHTKKSQQPHQHCALTEVTRLLAQTFAAQAARYEAGNTKPMQEAWVLLQLHEVIRLGVCTRTRKIPLEEMPTAGNLLEQLPSPWRKRLRAAILAEIG